MINSFKFRHTLDHKPNSSPSPEIPLSLFSPPSSLALPLLVVDDTEGIKETNYDRFISIEKPACSLDQGMKSICIPT
jgi:hypothetical protein